MGFMRGLRWPRTLKVGYHDLESLCKNYFNPNCRFPHSWWNYHEALFNSDFYLSIDSLENLNGRFKTKVGVGYVSRDKKYKILKEFHLGDISEYTAKVTKNRMPVIKNIS